MRRSSFSLIEVLIAGFLVTLVASALFFWVGFQSRKKKEMELLKEEVRRERNGDYRLKEVFSGLRGDSIFFTDEAAGNLTFLFHNGVDRSPYLSDLVVGQLSFDANEKALLLTLWPAPKCEKEQPVRTQVLFEGIEGAEFSFYSPKEQRGLVVDPEKVQQGPEAGWQRLWKKSWKGLPALIKLQVKKRDEIEERIYCYDLLHYPKPPVVKR